MPPRKRVGTQYTPTVDQVRHTSKPDKAAVDATKRELVVRAGEHAIARQIGASGFRQIIDALGIYPEFSALRDEQLQRKKEQQ